MRIINVVEQLQGSVSQILSFPVHEEQLSQDVVDQAEKTFADIITEVTGQTDLDSYIEDGYYTDNQGWEVSIIWSDTI